VHLVTLPAISAVAFCPHPPLLLPGIAAGAEIETESLRFACDQAVGRLIETGPSQVVILGADGPPVSLRSFAPGLVDPDQTPGLVDPDRRRLPLALLVGEWLLSRQPHRPPSTSVRIGPDGAAIGPWPDMTAPTALLVMGDGSARRSVKGPGYLDERAQPFDDAVVDALANPARGALANLDLTLAAELLVAAAAVWVATAKLAGVDWHGEILYADAPYGVMYMVATWLP
jgi:hypothetical protein